MTVKYIIILIHSQLCYSIVNRTPIHVLLIIEGPATLVMRTGAVVFIYILKKESSPKQWQETKFADWHGMGCGCPSAGIGISWCYGNASPPGSIQGRGRPLERPYKAGSVGLVSENHMMDLSGLDGIHEIHVVLHRDRTCVLPCYHRSSFWRVMRKTNVIYCEIQSYRVF